MLWTGKKFAKHIEIVCYLSEYSKNGCPDECHEKFSWNSGITFTAGQLYGALMFSLLLA